MALTRKQALQKAHDRAANNLFCYSKNYGMTIPKQGLEAEWAEAKEECEILEAMIREMEAVKVEPMKVYDLGEEEEMIFKQTAPKADIEHGETQSQKLKRAIIKIGELALKQS